MSLFVKWREHTYTISGAAGDWSELRRSSNSCGSKSTSAVRRTLGQLAYSRPGEQRRAAGELRGNVRRAGDLVVAVCWLAGVVCALRRDDTS